MARLYSIFILTASVSPIVPVQGCDVLVTMFSHLTDITNSPIQFPESTYPDGVDPRLNGIDLTNATSPPFYPSPWMDGSGGWKAAYAKAQDFVRQLTLLEKVNLTTGVGQVYLATVSRNLTLTIGQMAERGLCWQCWLNTSPRL